MTKKILTVMMVLLFAITPVCLAATDICQQGTPDDYESSVKVKLMRGVYNAAFGWVELIRRPATADDPIAAIVDGVAYGIGRTAAGASEVAIFAIPKWKVPTLNPVCPFQKRS